MDAPPIEVNVRPPLFFRKGTVSICMPQELDTFNNEQKALISHMIILGARSAASYGKVFGFVIGTAVSFGLFWLAAHGWQIP